MDGTPCTVTNIDANKTFRRNPYLLLKPALRGWIAEDEAKEWKVRSRFAIFKEVFEIFFISFFLGRNIKTNPFAEERDRDRRR